MNKNDRNFCDSFINKNVNNTKAPRGRPYSLALRARFNDVLSDPNNLLIERCSDAGKVINGCVIMHNGIKVLEMGYYGPFSKILQENKGCHEPSEERLFGEVLKDDPEGGVMIELGSYWAFYTIWFNTFIKNAKNYCIEPDRRKLNIGKQNCELNNVKSDFTQAEINKKFKLSNFVQEKGIETIDILHCDIQGAELNMLQDIVPLLKEKRIRYLFISTNKKHYDCIKLLEENEYRIIASANLEETFCYDGVIVSSHKDNENITKTSLGNRTKTKLRDTPYD